MHKKIFALVGPSGSGKTSLILDALKHLPDKIGPIKVLTTRARRGPEDDVFCRFVSRDEIERLRDAGRLVQYLEYAGNVYGCDRHDIESVLRDRCGIQAYVESGIADLERAGFEVVPIHIIPYGNTAETDEQRRRADRARTAIKVNYAFTIENRFEPGGFERATKELRAALEQECNI